MAAVVLVSVLNGAKLGDLLTRWDAAHYSPSLRTDTPTAVSSRSSPAAAAHSGGVVDRRPRPRRRDRARPCRERVRRGSAVSHGGNGAAHRVAARADGQCSRWCPTPSRCSALRRSGPGSASAEEVARGSRPGLGRRRDADLRPVPGRRARGAWRSRSRDALASAGSGWRGWCCPSRCSGRTGVPAAAGRYVDGMVRRSGVRLVAGDHVAVGALRHTIDAATPGGYADSMGWAQVFAFELVSMALGVLVTVVSLFRKRWAKPSGSVSRCWRSRSRTGS